MKLIVVDHAYDMGIEAARLIASVVRLKSDAVGPCHRLHAAWRLPGTDPDAPGRKTGFLARQKY